MLYRPRKNKKPPTVCVAVLKGIYHYRFLLGASIHFSWFLPLISHMHQCEKSIAYREFYVHFYYKKVCFCNKNVCFFARKGYLFCPMLWYSCIEDLIKNDWLCAIQSTTVPTNSHLVGTFIFPCVNYNCHNNTNQMILYKTILFFIKSTPPLTKRGFFLIFLGFF